MRKERQKGREERQRWEIRERIDLFILFVGIDNIYIYIFNGLYVKIENGMLGEL